MWRRRSSTVFVTLSRTSAEWRIGDSDVQTRGWTDTCRHLAELATTIREQAVSTHVGALRVATGSSLSRHWLQTPPDGIRSLRELKALVHARADQLFGADPGWRVAGDWATKRSFVCAALPAAVEEWAIGLATAMGIPLQLATPFSSWLNAESRSIPSDGWCVALEADVAHMLHVKAGSPVYLRTVNLQPSQKPADLQATLDAELRRSAALGGGLPTEPAVQVRVASPTESRPTDPVPTSNSLQASRSTP